MREVSHITPPDNLKRKNDYKFKNLKKMKSQVKNIAVSYRTPGEQLKCKVGMEIYIPEDVTLQFGTFNGNDYARIPNAEVDGVKRTISMNLILRGKPVDEEKYPKTAELFGSIVDSDSFLENCEGQTFRCIEIDPATDARNYDVVTFVLAEEDVEEEKPKRGSRR